MAQWLSVLATLQRQLTATCNFSSSDPIPYLASKGNKQASGSHAGKTHTHIKSFRERQCSGTKLYVRM